MQDVSGTPHDATAIERLVRRDRQVVIASLLGMTLLCWLWILPMARDMYGPMTGPSAWMMTARWDLQHVLLLFAGGVMNLYVIAGLMLLVLVEKLAPFGGRTSRITGALLLAGGAWITARSSL